MTFDETRTTQRWQPSARWVLLVPVLVAAGTLSAISTAVIPPQGFADIRVLHFIAGAPVFDPPEFGVSLSEVAHEMAPAQGEIK